MYINIEITHYNNGPWYAGHIDCNYYEIPYSGADVLRRKLDLNTARKLQWELMLAGGEREICSNRFDAAICSSSVTYWTPSRA